MKPIKKNVFKKREVNKVLTGDQIRGIEMITGPKIEDYESGYQIYGSYKYKSQQYPSDIDLSQIYEFFKNDKRGRTREEATNLIVKIIQETVRKISSTRDMYLGDVKIGIDKVIHEDIIVEQQDFVYEEIGIYKMWNDYLKKNKMKEETDFKYYYYMREKAIPQLLINGYEINYPREKIIKLWKKVYDDGKISRDTYERIKEVVPTKLKGKSGIEKVFRYFEETRQALILRWTESEVMEGVKLVGNREITIHEAVNSAISIYCINRFDGDRGTDGECSKNGTTIQVSHLIKIDMFAIVNGKIQEFSNTFSLRYRSKTRPNQMTNLTLSFEEDFEGDKSEDTRRSLLVDLTSYYYEISSKHKNMMKFAKREFVLAMLDDNKDIGVKLTKLFKSDINLLNYVYNQISVVVSILETRDDAPIDVIMRQLEALKFEISRITDLNVNESAFYELIDKIIKGDMTKDSVIEVLKELKEHVLKKINKEVQKYLKSVNLYPGPYVDKKYVEFVYG